MAERRPRGARREDWPNQGARAASGRTGAGRRPQGSAGPLARSRREPSGQPLPAGQLPSSEGATLPRPVAAASRGRPLRGDGSSGSEGRLVREFLGSGSPPPVSASEERVAGRSVTPGWSGFRPDRRASAASSFCRRAGRGGSGPTFLVLASSRSRSQARLEGASRLPGSPGRARMTPGVDQGLSFPRRAAWRRERFPGSSGGARSGAGGGRPW